MEFHYVALLSVTLIAITFLLTKRFAIPKKEVIDVSYIERSPFEVLVIQDEFMLNENDLLYQPSISQEALFNESKHRIVSKMPLNAFECTYELDHMRNCIKYRTTLKFLPPKKRS